MSPGANLSHACRCAGEAHRMLMVAVLHLEAADLVVPDLDALIGDDFAVDVATCLEDLDTLTVVLQRLADAYGHRETGELAIRRSAA